MKIIVESTYPPALQPLSNGQHRIVAGTIKTINGLDTKLHVLPAGIGLEHIVWRRYVPPVAAGTTRTVKGSRPGVTYTLTQQASGRWACTCPGYSFRRTCKHSSAA